VHLLAVLVFGHVEEVAHAIGLFADVVAKMVAVFCQLLQALAWFN
jgi:hypothetical protein